MSQMLTHIHYTFVASSLRVDSLNNIRERWGRVSRRLPVYRTRTEPGERIEKRKEEKERRERPQNSRTYRVLFPSFILPSQLPPDSEHLSFTLTLVQHHNPRVDLLQQP